MKSDRLVLSLALVLMLFVSIGGSMAQEHEEVQWEPWGPRVDEILMPLYPNYGSQISAFERCELDVMPGMSGSGDVVRAKATPNTDIVTNYGFHMYYLCFNTERAPLNADPLHQEIAHLVDRDRIISEVLQGYMLPLAHFLPPSCAFYRDDVSARTYDPDKAAEILDSAGYKMDTATKTRRDPATGKPMREMTILVASSSVGPYISRLRQSASMLSSSKPTSAMLSTRPASGTGGVIRWPISGEPKRLNPCTATSAIEWEVLRRINDGLIATHPETLEDIPWMARAWEIGTWEPAEGKRGTASPTSCAPKGRGGFAWLVVPEKPPILRNALAPREYCYADCQVGRAHCDGGEYIARRQAPQTDTVDHRPAYEVISKNKRHVLRRRHAHRDHQQPDEHKLHDLE